MKMGVALGYLTLISFILAVACDEYRFILIGFFLGIAAVFSSIELGDTL